MHKKISLRVETSHVPRREEALLDAMHSLPYIYTQVGAIYIYI